ncbi:hypothetical protein C8R45DRAFT_983622 [Mycena sanguinolenta]|nr:hypothetical protein C8R45DRAFT_983622 [Mycena sanguinolenta]
MKRGFLNGAKAKSRPLGPIPSEATRPVPASEPAPSMCCPKCAIEKQKKGDFFVPEGFPYTKTFYEGRDPRGDPRGGSEPGMMLFTSIPFLSDDNEQVSECLFYHGTKEALMQIPNFPHPMLRVDTPAFCVTDIPGKGMGLVSTRELKMGDLILDERPLFVCSRGVPLPEPPSTFTNEKFMQYHLQKLEEYYQHSLGRMRPKVRDAYLALHNCHKEDESGTAVGIVRTNGMALLGLRPDVQDESSQYSAVCKDISRLNHSCSPNTAPRFHVSSFSYRLYAVRDIAEGEELTYQYTDVVQSAAKRQAELKPYDFVCACRACKDPSTSDPHRAAVAKFYAANIGMLTSPFLTVALLAKCRKQIELIVREGLEHHPVYFDVVKLLMEGCIAHGDARGASEWAARLEKCSWGENRDNADVVKLLKSGPTYRNHPLWRTLVDAGVPSQRLNMAQMFKKRLAERAPANINVNGCDH